MLEEEEEDAPRRRCGWGFGEEPERRTGRRHSGTGRGRTMGKDDERKTPGRRGEGVGRRGGGEGGKAGGAEGGEGKKLKGPVSDFERGPGKRWRWR